MNPRKDLSREYAALQERLGASQGKKYWRTLEELADDEAFQELVRYEFPEQADVWPDHLSRRRFLMLMGASLALAGVGGCSVQPAPSTEIVPYVHPPEEITPGKPLFYATAMTVAGDASGLLVESHLGRPTKIEGNPNHPGSLGSTDLFNQAAVLELYDPDRSQTVTYLGKTRTWDEALATIRTARDKQFNRPKAERGKGLRLLTGRVVSPTLAAQIAELRELFPAARWHQYEPIYTASSLHAAQWAFGTPINLYHDFTRADVVLSLDADFLTCGPGRLRNVADFMGRRRLVTQEDPSKAKMNRLYVVETNVSSTGAKADHRLALRAWEIEPFALALASRLGVKEAGGGNGMDAHKPWIEAVARDLEKHNKGRCVVLAGERQPPAVHLLVHRINHLLENVGKTVFHTEPIEARPADELASLEELLKVIDKGDVEMLGIVDCNPVFTAPPEMKVVERLQKVPLLIHLGLYQDETARQCHWHLPQTHFLEEWSDTRAFDGTATIVQPLIQPLYQGRSAHEILSVVGDGLVKPGYEIVKAHWKKKWQVRGQSTGSFEDYWETSVHDGVVADTKLPHKTFTWKGDWHTHLKTAETGGGPELEIVFQPDPTIYDGRFANNGWLQELPKPITKLTWDNAALMSPKTASDLKVNIGGYAHGGEHGGFHSDVVELKLGDEVVQAPVWVVPGHADGSITVYLGYGREYAGRVGGTGEERVGFNAYRLRTVARPWFAPGLTVRKTGDNYTIACTQQHQLMEYREPVREATLEKYREKPDFVKEKHEKEDQNLTVAGARKPLTMYKEYPYPEHKWGMVIDLTTCTGCKACVVACQAENNIPVVGKDQVLAGREMHWLRIDRYSTGPYERPEHYFFQPIPCMHCEQAPCEYVCPVEATVHSAEGLNEMLYQRCVGTRFCSNNCPYKVRRFNFFAYSDFETQSRRLQYNPDVTVRSRGVMEKCSYCVQRIRHAEIESQVQNRGIADGEVLTACQAACPAQAIVFGDLNDEKSTVRKWHDSPLNYGLLAELNTHPRTTYLGAVRNPNPDLERLERKAE
jgi:MoCo/4Fe-4S cofactor protein with predicted Tat translocation signal